MRITNNIPSRSKNRFYYDYMLILLSTLNLLVQGLSLKNRFTDLKKVLIQGASRWY